MRLVCSIFLLCLLSGCAITQYIPSKHFVSTELLVINEKSYEFYQKQINGKPRKVFKITDVVDMVFVYQSERIENPMFEFYYELDSSIQVDQAISLIRSITPQRTRIYSGESSDFGMLRVEPTLNEEYTLAERKVREVIKEIIHVDDLDEIKIKAVHDYIVQHTAYDVAATSTKVLSQEDSSLSVYGTMFRHLAVCEGYARTFLLFMQELGIPSMIIEAQEMNHAWNYVLVNGEWKFIDVTYDDPVPDQKNQVRYDYFLLSKNQLLEKGNHTFDTGVEVGIAFDLYAQAVEVLFP